MTLAIRDDVPLAPLTTLELGGPARHFVDARDDDTVAEALRWADARGLRVLILGGGSNMVVADAGFDGLVVRIATRGRRFDAAAGTVTAAAGEPWDALVAETVTRGLAGLECLSGIPGLVGATPIQNVGAYGQEVAETIRRVRVLERPQRDALRPAARRLRVRLPRQRVQARSGPLRRPGRDVRAAPGRRADAPLPGARRGAGAVTRGRRRRWRTRAAPCWRCAARNRWSSSTAIRTGAASGRSSPTRSSASKRRTPSAARAVALGVVAAPGDMPHWPAPGGGVKLSAGWLIERAGIDKGLRRGAVGVSTAHALALVHHGGGSTAALLELARDVRDAVRARFAISLTPEPTLIGMAWSEAQT